MRFERGQQRHALWNEVKGEGWEEFRIFQGSIAVERSAVARELSSRWSETTGPVFRPGRRAL